jgi:tetratricopeptide (TPR) repeat protein
MKTYQNKRFGFEIDVPEEWSLPSGGASNTPFGESSIIFGCGSSEAFNLQIGPINPEPPLDQTENEFRRYVEDNGHISLALDRLTVEGKEHVWARYYMWNGIWTKKYRIVLSGTEYAFTATCFDQKILIQREKVWDTVVASFRLLIPANEVIKPKRELSESKSETDNRYKWAVLQMFQAVSYVTRKGGERAENLGHAIHRYQQALEVFTRQAYPKDWASAQNDLGEAYRNLSILRDRAENLEQAIFHYQQALEVGTRQDYPELWAAIHNNLGIAYANGVDGDQAENLEQAILHCQQALEVYTRDAFPDDWAMTQNNLGQAYRKRIRGDRADNIEQAISRYQQALEVQVNQPNREQWAGTHSNLALACLERPQGERVENLERVIVHTQQALEVYTCGAYPEDYARLQYLLAIVSQELNSSTKNPVAANPISNQPILTHPQFYDEESKQQPGKKCALRLIDSLVPDSKYAISLMLAYQWEAELSEEEAQRLRLRAVAYISCAIYDAARAAGLSCRVSDISNGRRPAWLIASERMPISLTISDIDASDRTLLMSIGPVVVSLREPSGDAHLLAKLLEGFKGRFSNITV